MTDIAELTSAIMLQLSYFAQFLIACQVKIFKDVFGLWPAELDARCHSTMHVGSQVVESLIIFPRYWP